MMSNSTIDLIRAARANALDDFKMRFKQKWFGDVPCFHWRELKFSDEFKTNMEHENPSLYLISFVEETMDLEDKTWEMNELQSVFVFEERESILFENTQFETWLENSLEQFQEENATDYENLILCYCEGTTYAAQEWRTHFEKQLKI